MNSALQAEAVSKSFNQRPVLRDITLDIPEGAFVTLAGGNGAGKTTLLKILAKLMKPDSGSIHIYGKDIWKESDAARSNIGFLSHQILMYNDLNALENLRFTARLFGMLNYDDRIVEVLKQMHLYHRQYDPVKTYSRGMQQRLSLARAILHDPDILILDEPFSGLDESGIDIFTEYIESIRTQQKSAILVSHNLQIGYRLADTVYILSKGRIGFRAETKDVPYEVCHREYRQLLEAEG
ncbi:MAG: heme ABC exporter ATP-binding protein CcmA [Candidatus Marinimicrobia bacterium]|nr:heme ABC exporter ATP-binding protein CcmA [Candidatus Neomarinimicrobiota bacterium]MCF7828989.1 heme ABC exporter ATP-binding protein CcmA [Candidatus Neomarinimicrobiota bacterium]MCF7879949.1 heme ABC exporter ATP-binding protein CcmA [Candidatus Neomarinimicrobiota bacterium]